MARVLIVSGHPDPSDSVANETIVSELSALLPDAEVDDLGKLYPDFQIDVAAEQAKLVAADVIVLQYPVWWYSYPSLMHKWMEDVFVHGFSHGSTGDKLAGKKLVVSFTAGAPESMYEPGAGVITVDDMLVPLKATCKLTRMEFVGHVFTGGVSYLTRVDDAARQQIAERAKAHAHKVADLVEQL